jgi:hypothetical protein
LVLLGTIAPAILEKNKKIYLFVQKIRKQIME